MDIIFNKRKFERLRTSDLSALFSRNWNEIAVPVEVLNICVGGLCFLTNSVMRVDEKIILTFPFNTKFVVLKCIVTWNLGREVGVKFLDSRKEIMHFMDIFNKEYSGKEDKLCSSKNKLVAPPDFLKKENNEYKNKGSDISIPGDYK